MIYISKKDGSIPAGPLAAAVPVKNDASQVEPGLDTDFAPSKSLLRDDPSLPVPRSVLDIPDLKLERAAIAPKSVFGHSAVDDLKDSFNAIGMKVQCIVMDFEDKIDVAPLQELYRVLTDFSVSATEMIKKTGVDELTFNRYLNDSLQIMNSALEYLPILRSAGAEDPRLEVLLNSSLKIVKAQIDYLSDPIPTENVSCIQFFEKFKSTEIKPGSFPLGFVSDNLPKTDSGFITHTSLLIRSIYECAKNSFEFCRQRHAPEDKNRLRLLPTEVDKFFVKLREEGEWAVIELEDHVGGFSWETLREGKLPGRQRAFDRDCTTKGGGAGLCELWHTVTNMNGRVEIHNHKAGELIPRPLEKTDLKEQEKAEALLPKPDGAVIRIYLPKSIKS